MSDSPGIQRSLQQKRSWLAGHWVDISSRCGALCCALGGIRFGRGGRSQTGSQLSYRCMMGQEKWIMYLGNWVNAHFP